MSAPLQAPHASLSAAASATDEEQRLGASDAAADRWMLDGSDARVIFGRLLPSPAEMAAAGGTGGGACSRVGLAYNAAALAGWVPQPSPCCAAAAVAGAWNSLAGLRRCDDDGGSDSRIISAGSADSSAHSLPLAPPMLHDRVLATYARQLSSALAQRHRSFERRLGAASSAAPLLHAIGAGLRAAGRDLTAKAGTHAHVTRRVLEAVVRAAAVAHHQQQQQEKESALQPQQDSQPPSAEDGNDNSVKVTSISSMAASANIASRSALDCVIELLALDGVDVAQLDAAAEAEAVRQLSAATRASDASDQATGSTGAGTSVDESDDENDKVFACCSECVSFALPLPIRLHLLTWILRTRCTIFCCHRTMATTPQL